MRPSIRRSAIVSQLLVVGALAPAALAGQSRTEGVSAQERSRPVITAAPRSGPIRLDGHLDDVPWAEATPASDFTQQRPSEGRPASERTEVRFLFDDDALYVGARMYDSLGAAGVTRHLARRDQGSQSDALRIDLDTYRDRLYSVQFVVTPSGGRTDVAGGDSSWDPVWEAATQVDSTGWTVEARIPFSQLRFSRDSVQSWGLNLIRVIQRKQERDMWSFWRQNEPGGPAFFGELRLRVRRQPRHMELLPYVVARNERISSGNPESPFYDPNSSAMKVGGDLKYLIASNLTLSATVNPDFGQVEVDPAVVNLTAFETFFPERRPFFVEGGSLFEFGTPGCNNNCGPGLTLFYSRRVGRSPQGAALAFAAGPYVDIPENAAILGAAKLTGRTAGGFTVGLLNAVTRREMAEVETRDSTWLLQPVEPLTNSFVGRVRREMRGGSLVLGGILTSVNRDLEGPGLASVLPGSAQSAGVDVEYFWGKRTYRLYAGGAASRVAGDSGAIRRLQRSSARYLQRPDREAASNGLFSYAYDPSATDLGGYGAIARLAKQAGNWLWDLNLASVSPGFETNDLGFQQRADWRWVNGTLGRQFTKPTPYYRTLRVMAGGSRYWNYDGDVTDHEVTGTGNVELPNYWDAFLGVRRNFPAVSDQLTRGGPVVGLPGRTWVLFNLGTDARRRLMLRTNFSGLAADDGGSDISAGVDATIRPASHIWFSLGPGFRRTKTTDQYVGSVADTTARMFYGRRYVFARVDQTQLFMTTRASITFTPNLSLELFAQPLLASTDYYGFQEFAAPRRREKLRYGQDIGTITATGTGGERRYVIDPDGEGRARSFTVGNPDFNLRSLRGTGVLRWEWRPGSTAYLAWTQRRSGQVPVGDFDFRRDGDALLSTPADNVLLLKVSYWLGL